MLSWLRRFLIGSPLPSSRAIHERLPKITALPIFASDALSSVAYATEEILIILVAAGTTAVHTPTVFYISAAIAILLAIVATSYRQTINAYPSGGGAYIVAKENLGDLAGLTAGAALTIDYTLTVAVSMSAGIFALTSAYPALQPYRVELGLFGVALLTLINLRGARESGILFAMPTYAFIFGAFVLIAVGIFRLETTGITAATSRAVIKPLEGLGLFLILRAFSSGCSAMTGTEAISNAVQAFKPPESKNASVTLVIMASILGIMFLGISYLAWETKLVPLEQGTHGYQTVISQLAQTVFGRGGFYLFIQFATALILILAANTSFAGFPRLASIMARDRFFPRQFYNIGDRLVYSNGIVVLALLASTLIIVFKGIVTSLIPLYAIGVFLSFTLSQSGMAVHFWRLKEYGWQAKAALSAFGAFLTAIVTIVQAVTKFTIGAWIVVVLIFVLLVAFSKVHKHYIELGNKLRLTPDDHFENVNNTVLVLTPSLHRGVLPALEYAKGLAADVRAIHVEVDPLDTALLIERWERWGGGIPLIILESPYRTLTEPLLDYLEEAKLERENYVISVVIPEFVPKKWWEKLLHNQSGLQLKFALLFRRDIVTTNVRYYLD